MKRKVVTVLQVLAILALIVPAVISYWCVEAAGFLAAVIYFICCPASFLIMWFGSEDERIRAAEIGIGISYISGFYCFFSLPDYAFLVVCVVVATNAIGGFLYLTAPQAKRRMSD